jgi:hypothetical protein
MPGYVDIYFIGRHFDKFVVIWYIFPPLVKLYQEKSGNPELDRNSIFFIPGLRELPPRTDGHDWVLKFSTSKDGFALNSLIRKLAKVEGPVILIMSDIPGAVFGAFLSDAPKFSEHFEGTGETFLFTLKPDYQVNPRLHTYMRLLGFVDRAANPSPNI